MTAELKIKLVLWEIKSNNKNTGKELLDELKNEMQLEQNSFRRFLDELQELGYIKIEVPNKTTFGNISLTIKGEQHLSFSEEERLDIILDYCKDMVSIAVYNHAMWGKIQRRVSGGNLAIFESKIKYLVDRKLIVEKLPLGYIATPDGLMFEGFVIEKSKRLNPNPALEKRVLPEQTFTVCPFTSVKVNVKVESSFYEYSLSYNNHNYTIRLGGLDWFKINPLNDSNRWIFQGMLFNNEWPIEPETIITHPLIERIIRIKYFPDDFEKKWQYYLAQCFKNGGNEYIPIIYDNLKFQSAYAIDPSEFDRIKGALISKGFIKNQSDIELTEDGWNYAKNFISNRDKTATFYTQKRPRVIIVSTLKDKFYEEKLKDFLHNSSISIVGYGLIHDEWHGNAFNMRESLLRDDHDYIIFIKSASSDKNNTYGSAWDNASLLHRTTDRRKAKYIFLAVVDDSGIDTRPFFIDYNSNAYDFRILSSRQAYSGRLF